ncbi:MAG TPA: ferritin-like domain-containing protein [Gaiellaceae bacterium]|nr:ferritin-like domain-containing protein [Gaiellaceae bacterium]
MTTLMQREQSTPAAAAAIELLTHAYLMEMETVANYLAASANLDGVRAQEVVRALAGDVDEELGHARRLAERLNQLGAVVPGSHALLREQDSLQPRADAADVEGVIRGVLEAEEAAITHYRKLIEDTDGVDWVTQDLAISILADEEAHRRLFESFLREYERDRR